jgi:hypothetical protein
MRWKDEFKDMEFPKWKILGNKIGRRIYRMIWDFPGGGISKMGNGR